MKRCRASLSAMPIEPGTTLGSYQVTAKLGKVLPQGVQVSTIATEV